MGKSNKSKRRRNDSRGYGQHQPKSVPSSSQEAVQSSIVLSKERHDGIVNLVEQLQEQRAVNDDGNGPQTQPLIIDARFTSKLTNIVKTLLELGFTDDQLDSLTKNLSEDWSVEAALDWLCLNIPTLELPPLFTDGHLRNSLMGLEKIRSNGTTNISAEALTVLKFIINTQDSAERKVENIVISNPELIAVKGSRLLEAEQQRLDQEAKDEAELKARILQEYTYANDCDSDDGDFGYNDDKAKNENPVQVQVPFPIGTAEQPLPPPLSPLEHELQLKERELESMEADLTNEANNYMRSKQEIKQLHQEAKHLRKDIAGMKRKVEKERQEKEKTILGQNQPSECSSVEIEENDDLISDFFGGDFFGTNSERDEHAPIQKTAGKQPEEELKSLLDAVVPKGWTGTTPRVALDDICRKKKLGRPKYQNLPSKQGTRLTIPLKKKHSVKEVNEWTALEADFVNGSSLQDYLALQALYDMDPTLPMHIMFPPSFRDLWLFWTSEKERGKHDTQEKEEKIQRDRINRLLVIIEEKILTTKKRAEILEEKNSEKSRYVGVVRVSTLEDSQKSKVDDESKKRHEGANLRADFLNRRDTHEYKGMKKLRETLPITGFRAQILQAVAVNPVIVLVADTGAGKTTQCPQYLLEEALLDGRGQATNIVCTQPRRVAATTVAERVAEEMTVRLGSQVGYQIRMESKRSRETKLLFCTTGVLLRRLQDDRNLSNVSHVIVDEVHERQAQTDVLLICLKQLLSTTRPDLKVLLMSATLDCALFSDFFCGAPIIQVPGRTFPVNHYYLEDLIEATGHIIEEGSMYAVPEHQNRERVSLWITGKGGERWRESTDMNAAFASDDFDPIEYRGYSKTTRLSMARVDENVINYDLIEDVLQLLVVETPPNILLRTPDGATTSSGAILVFLPGLREIRTLAERLTAHREAAKFQIIPLHSKLSSSEQRKAFTPAKPGNRKIILSTNIAETSLTIPDVVIVIDSGRERVLRRNKRTSTSILVTEWCSKASTKQRAGRAGRVQPGLCLKMFSSRMAQTLKGNSEPELKRIPLEEVCLSILASGLGKNCQEFLDQAPQPPDPATVLSALDVLREVGAITKTGERLTTLGQHIARLPVDVRLGKMLIFGSLFKCLDKALTIAASLCTKSPFLSFLNDSEVAKAKHKRFQDPDSDFKTLCNVFEGYRNARLQPTASGRLFCQANFLNHVSLQEMRTQRLDFFNLLTAIGFVSEKERLDSPDWVKSSINQYASDWTIVHSVVSAALWPNIALVKETKPGFYHLWQKNEVLYFHNSSVNSTKKRFAPSERFVCYFERFGTANRESISTTCFVSSMSVLLFGGHIDVRHKQRKVLIDDWIEIEMAAQVGVLLRQLREQIDELLRHMIERTDPKFESNIMLQNLIRVLSPARSDAQLH